MLLLIFKVLCSLLIVGTLIYSFLRERRDRQDEIVLLVLSDKRTHSETEIIVQLVDFHELRGSRPIPVRPILERLERAKRIRRVRPRRRRDPLPRYQIDLLGMAQIGIHV